MSIPRFDPSSGNLPPGVHTATWDEFSARFGGNPARSAQLVGLRLALDALKAAGCPRVFVDGSFVTSKESPGDFDACWDPDGVDPDRLDPVLLDYSNARAAQKRKFLGELFVMDARADRRGTSFLEFFQVDKRTGRAKGIVEIRP